MIIFCFVLLCGLVQGQVVPVENDSPSFYAPGACAHPVEAVAEHKEPISDGEIAIALFTAGNETDQRVEIWAPESEYRIVVTSESKLDLLVGVNGGTLAREDEGVEDCDGAMWYTKARDTKHEVAWKTPACCEFGGKNVQIFVTGARHDTDRLRQQELFVEADQSKCSCAGATTPPEPTENHLPEEAASEGLSDGDIHFTDAEEPPVTSPGAGEIDPNTISDEVKPVVSTKPSDDKSSSSFGYVFLIMLLTICIALSAVWFYRKYRVRQMQYREFEGLEMRGYAQWSDAAGL